MTPEEIMAMISGATPTPLNGAQTVNPNMPRYSYLNNPATNTDLGTAGGWGGLLQQGIGLGTSIYNATQAGRNAQTVVNTSDPFNRERPQYQTMLQQNLGKQTNPALERFMALQGNQPNAYTGAYDAARANQNDPYAAIIARTIGNQSNSYADKFNAAYGNQPNDYAKQLQGLLTDPNSFKTDPGYQFALQQGQEGVSRASNALYGTARAGSLAPELAKYTEGYAAQSYDNRINQLAGLTNAQNTYNSNTLNTLGSAAANQNTANNQNLSVLGNLSGQAQTTNTAQLAQLAGLIGTTNSYNLGNLGALNQAGATQATSNAQLINSLLQASGANSGSPVAAGQALVGGQQNQASSIGAALQAIPGLAQYVPQILQMIGGGSGGATIGVGGGPANNVPGVNYPPPDDGTGGYGGGVNVPPPDDGTGGYDWGWQFGG